MIIVQLKGGLGNQLFQYAAAMSLAHLHQTSVKVDINLLKAPDKSIGTVRSFDLQCIKHPPEVASDEEIAQFLSFSIFNLFDKLKPAYQRKIYKEEAFTFDENFYKAGKAIYLKGYRQSPLYFKSIEQQIREEFVIQDKLIEKVVDLAKSFQQAESVAIHIRRGDYNKPNVVNYHGLLDQHYYNRAINFMNQQFAYPKFYIFSDDINWVKQYLSLPSDSMYIDASYSDHPITDFYLISKCKHQIIANSTFSWWAAYLNTYPQKIVIAPKHWFANPKLSTRDLLPNTWVKL